MSDPTNLPIGPRGPGAPTRGSTGFGARVAASAGGGAERAAPGRDPFDLDGAMTRLKTLLAFDGPNGPRENAPRRGFYLNILA
ncbi:MAG: hypothetical protein NXI21_08770 [Alphaproteobacteria bacterium]|nr:hypothetical protein [Alphaproteobacteria bacterium]